MRTENVQNLPRVNIQHNFVPRPPPPYTQFLHPTKILSPLGLHSHVLERQAICDNIYQSVVSSCFYQRYKNIHPFHPIVFLLLCHNTRRQNNPKGWPVLDRNPLYLFVIEFMMRVQLLSCTSMNTHAHNILVYLLDNIFPVLTVMWPQIRDLHWKKYLICLNKGF